MLNYLDVREALEGGQLGGLGIDVFHTEPFPVGDPFLQLPTVVSTPHVAGVTEISYSNMSDTLAENIRRIANSLPPLNQVN